MILATVSALLALAVHPTGSPTVEDLAPDETVGVGIAVSGERWKRVALPG